MARESRETLLKGVSRSFYLSLRLLPAAMRPAASLAYLLARTSDTLADAASASVKLRNECLEAFRVALEADGPPPRWPAAILNATADSREHRLLENTSGLMDWRASLAIDEREAVDEVLDVIIGGQLLDLKRFAAAQPEAPVVWGDAADLEDYTWRVAGCVGAFWTKLGFITMGDRFAKVSLEELIPRGNAYGKGLQLVNILRDLPEDLAAGRCYLPVADPTNRAQVMAEHQAWLRRAMEWVREGRSYAAGLRSRRLKAASVLPALLAEETLAAMEGVTWSDLEKRIKLPRRRVYRLMARAWWV